jgi:hypothetical protein
MNERIGLLEPPTELELPPEVMERHLRLLRQAVTAPAPTKRWRRPSRRLLWVAAALALVAAGAVAAATKAGLFDRVVTRADLDARVTSGARTSDGVLFVDPDGRYISVVPAESGGGFDPASPYGRQLFRSLESRGENGENAQTTIELPGGGTRTIRWKRGEGTLTVTDEHADGTTATTTLRSGDVVPLVPGSLRDQPLTPDKAVTFELELRPDYGYSLWIYPQRNEAYVATPPWTESAKATAVADEDVLREVVRRFALSTGADRHRAVPIDGTGGRWTFSLADGTIRTVTWNAGDRWVTVTDRAPSGAIHGEEVLPIGTRVFAG